MKMLNKVFFYDEVRLRLFGGKLSSRQVEGLTAILDYWEINYKNGDARWLAYALGTCHWETDRTFQPITEYGKDAYFNKYNGRRDLGNSQAGDGLRFKGRGFVQITGRTNYEKFSKILSVDLVNNPEMALNLKIAPVIMFYGMEHGTFTGKKLADYFSGGKQDWVGARRIINGTDKATLIGDIAKKYYSAISII